jgi:transcriptional regulator GlxA family with amidase domain
VATHYEQLLMSILLQSQYHNYWDELQTEACPATPYYVKRAMAYMAEHPEQDITMETLVEQSGVSARSLYAGFQRFRDTTPMAYLKAERLRRARTDLLAADPSQVTVTAIATRWSFFHLGRFSGAYRKAFGEPPSATLKRSARKT